MNEQAVAEQGIKTDVESTEKTEKEEAVKTTQKTESAQKTDDAGISPEPDKKEDKKEFDTDIFKVDSLTIPEGFDEALVSEIASLAKDQGFEQKQAQSIIDREAQRIADEQGNPENWKQMVRDDAELGGANYEDNLDIARKGVRHFNSTVLSKWLTDSGAGNHPELVRVFYRIGKALANDSFVKGSAGASIKKTPEELFYGKSED